MQAGESYHFKSLLANASGWLALKTEGDRPCSDPGRQFCYFQAFKDWITRLLLAFKEDGLFIITFSKNHLRSLLVLEVDMQKG